MRGLTKGETSSKTNPILQLFCRSGGVLADFYSGTFKIDDIKDAGSSAAAVVASTPFVPATHQVGTGRYAIATGSTSSWSVGTHRVTCTYKMVAGGPDYIQTIDFEVLDPADWATGMGYVGYLSTRLALADSYVASTVTRQRLHRLIDEFSRRIEQWTGRWFEPRYVKLKKAGQDSPVLLLQQPIIAIEDIYAVWKTTTGEDTYKYEQYLYKVYNRHLDGFSEEDDRGNPRIELTDVTGTQLPPTTDFAWPYGNQNIELRGVFGYTDPDFDPNSGQIAIGKTPADLARAVGILAGRATSDPTMSDPTTWLSGSIRSMRTRDQSISFGGSSGGSSGGGGGGISDLSGDSLVDSILVKYCQPPAVGGL